MSFIDIYLKILKNNTKYTVNLCFMTVHIENSHAMTLFSQFRIVYVNKGMEKLKTDYQYFRWFSFT